MIFDVAKQISWLICHSIFQLFVEACETRKNVKIAIIDHISSCSAIKFPVKKIIEALKLYNVLTLIDGAHAPGQIPNLNLGK